MSLSLSGKNTLQMMKRKYWTDFRITCDEDGWVLAVNKDPPYPTFPHLFSLGAIEQVSINGRGAEISYAGFGPKGKSHLFFMSWK